MRHSPEPGMLLDIVSLARRGPNGRLSPEEVELVVRTLRRTPEVMVKVSGGATSTAGALAHLKYIDRHGELELETDEGIKLQGGDAERSVVEEWELDVLAARVEVPLSGYRRTQALQTAAQHRPVYAGRHVASKAPGGQPKLRT